MASKILRGRTSKKRYYDKMMSQKEGSMIAGPVGLALLPQNVVMKFYPKGDAYLPEDLNDGMSVVDEQKKKDVSETKRLLSKSKY